MGGLHAFATKEKQKSILSAPRKKKHIGPKEIREFCNNSNFVTYKHGSVY